MVHISDESLRHQPDGGEALLSAAVLCGIQLQRCMFKPGYTAWMVGQPDYRVRSLVEILDRQLKEKRTYAMQKQKSR